MSSPVISVVVGREDAQKTFLIHADILSLASEQLAAKAKDALTQKARTISLEEEDPKPFGFFVEYLYSDTWVFDSTLTSPEEFVDLARLYVFVRKNQMRPLQKAIVQAFKYSRPLPLVVMDKQGAFSVKPLCDLLGVVLKELPPMRVVDPLRRVVFAQAIKDARALRRHDNNGDFRRLAKEFPDLEEALGLGPSKSAGARRATRGLGYGAHGRRSSGSSLCGSDGETTVDSMLGDSYDDLEVVEYFLK